MTHIRPEAIAGVAVATVVLAVGMWLAFKERSDG